jgi:plastocyanin
MSRTDSAARTIFLTSSDSSIARPALACGGSALGRVIVSALTPGTSVLVCGLKAGRVFIKAQDSLNVFAPDSMVVTVVSTIELREVGAFSQQPNFYVNQNQTHNAQVFLSDPAPAGGLGVTFVYGKPGTTTVTPAPAIVPAGQLAANVVIQGLAVGTDSVVPTSGGFVGKFSRVSVAANNLTLQRPYPYTGLLGVGQTFQPYAGITYAMDHILVVNASLSSGIGTVQTPDTIRQSASTQYFTVAAAAPGKTVLTIAASGWVSAVDTFTFTTPHLLASGQGSLIAGNPVLGSWTVGAADSARGAHAVKDTLLVTAVSRNLAAVTVDSPTVKVPAGASTNTRYNGLRALAAGGGDSAWIVDSAPGYVSDSFLVHVTKPAMTVQVAYPYTGRLGLGTLWKSAGYVQLPYGRPDTFTVTFTHTRPGTVRAPPSVRVLPGQTIAYFDLVGDSAGVDTLRVDTVATKGYVITGTPIVFSVDTLHVRAYQYPGTTNYTISSPYPVNAAVYDSADGQYRPLIKPLRVNLVSTNVATFTLDSAAVTIDSGQFYSYNHPDTMRFKGVDTIGARIVASALGTRSDTSTLIKVFPTPLAIQLGYPYIVARGLRLKNNYVSVTGGYVPDTVKVAVRRFDPTIDTLTADTVKIAKGQSTSQTFEIWARDSIRPDSIVATAPGYVTGKVTLTPQPASLLQGGLPSTRLTTDPPYRAPVYTGTRSGYAENPFVPDTITVVSTDPTVMVIDSAFSTNARGDTAKTVVDTSVSYAYVRVHFVGNGSARLRFSSPGFRSDSTGLVTVSGPSLHLTTGNQTVGIGQVLPSQYVYVDNPVSAPLVVHLLRSDSLQPASGQVFKLSTDSVTIPVGQTSSNLFDVIGNSSNSAVLTARATAYGQGTATISVGTPQLVGPLQISVYVGSAPYSVPVYTADQNNNSRLIAAPLVVSASVSNPTIATSDSSSITLAARTSNGIVPVRARAKGVTSVIFSAPGYKSDTMAVTVDTGVFSFGSVPTTLGPNQTAQMAVSLSFTNDTAVTVSLAPSNPNALSVQVPVVIPARQGYQTFSVTGLSPGSSAVLASAPGYAKPATSAVIAISQPKLFVSLSPTGSAGQRAGLTIYAEDSLGTSHVVTAPVSVTLSSNLPTHTAFDATMVTIPVGSSSVSTGVTFDTAATYVITASAPAMGYASGTGTTTITGALVTMVNTAFSPSTVTIRAGQYVTWRNNDSFNHTTTENSATPLWNQLVAPGTTVQQYFATSGTYNYHCTIHANMTGTVIVTP